MPIPDIVQSILKFSSDFASLDYSIGDKSCQVSTVCWLRFSSMLDLNVIAIKPSEKLASSLQSVDRQLPVAIKAGQNRVR